MATKKWTLDPAHSELQFKVKHLMVSNVTGNFKDFQVQVQSGADDFQDARISVVVNVDSVSTGPADRDNHLKSGDFFDVANYPEMKFQSTRFRKMNEEGDYELDGELTIREVTKPVKLRAEFGGIAKDPWGNIKTAFSIQGKINRSEWGLNHNAVLETGGVLLSDEIRILAEVQMTEAVEQLVS